MSEKVEVSEMGSEKVMQILAHVVNDALAAGVKMHIGANSAGDLVLLGS